LNARFTDRHRAQRELLSGSQLLHGLPAAVLDELIAASRIVELSGNRNLYTAGEPIREAHILFSGNLQRTMAMPGGTTRVIELVQSEQLLSPGEIFSTTHYATTCASVAPALLVAIELRKLREAVARSHELSSRVILALARQQCATEFDVTGYHYGLTGTQRLLDYLLEQAGEPAGLAGETTVLLKASKKVIAARIGMTPESLSRNLRELSDNGVIVVDGRHVHIQNAALLDTVGSDRKQRLNFSRKRKGDAAPLATDRPSGALVNMCGRLRVLSQRMAVAWGMAAAGIEPHKARTRLRQLDKDFERNLERLGKYGLAPKLDEKLAAIKALWPRYAQAMASDEASAAEHVFALSEDMLAATDSLTSCAACATRLGGTPDAQYVNMAGRNRMLSQRIGKLFLFSEWGSLESSIADLSLRACEEFESNLKTLTQTAQDHPELAAQLQVVSNQWQKMIRALCPDLAHAGRAKHARLVVAEGERLLRCVDTSVKLFERLAT
jgi:CRP-like cAMP-binding protein